HHDVLSDLGKLVAAGIESLVTVWELGLTQAVFQIVRPIQPAIVFCRRGHYRFYDVPEEKQILGAGGRPFICIGWSEIAARFIFAKCARIHRIAMAKKDEITGEVLDGPGQVAVPVDGVEIDAIARGDDEAAGLDGIRAGQTAEKPPSRLRNGRQN